LNWELTIWLTGLMLLAYWLIYVMGSPNESDINKVDVGGILFGFPLWLADRRLKQNRLRDGIDEEYIQEGSLTNDPVRQRQQYKDWRRNRFDRGRNFFTWERSLTCPYCLHWWLTLIFGAVCLSFNFLHAREDLLLAGFLYLVNHLVIRKIV